MTEPSEKEAPSAPEPQPCAVPIEDQARQLHEHYDKASMAIHNWHSAIPRAIDLWEQYQRGELLTLDAARLRVAEQLEKHADDIFDMDNPYPAAEFERVAAWLRRERGGE